MLVGVLIYGGCALQLQVDLEGEGERDIQNQESFFCIYYMLHKTSHNASTITCRDESACVYEPQASRRLRCTHNSPVWRVTMEEYGAM